MKILSSYKLYTGLVVSLCIVSLGITSSVSAVSTDVGGKPARPDESIPRTKDIFIHTLANGSSKSDAVLLVNNTDEEKTLKLYVTDGVVTNTGALTCKQQSEETNQAGSWISLNTNEVTLSANSKKEVPFSIAVPEKASVGEHNACLVYQVKKQDVQEASGGVSVETRSATRVVVTVPGDLKKDLSVSKFDITTEKNTHLYAVDVNNAGNVSADVVVSVNLKGFFGETVFEDSGQFPALPQEVLNVSYRSDELPFFGGFYKATVEIAYDKRPENFGVNIEDRQNTVTYVESKNVFILPDPIVIAATVLLLFTLLIWRVYAVARKKKIKHTWGVYTVKEDDTLQSVADKFDTSWKRLARANKLKAPYVLNSGSALRVPKTKKKVKNKK